MEDNFVIGVLGGMGTYATINLFRQYADVFPAEKSGRDRELLLIIGVQCQAEFEHFYIMKMLKNSLMNVGFNEEFS